MYIYLGDVFAILDRVKLCFIFLNAQSQVCFLQWHKECSFLCVCRI